MKLLLDTATFLHAALEPKKLSARAAKLLLDPENERYLSVVSSWEIAIKYSLGKLRLPNGPGHFIPTHREHMGATILPLDEESVFHVTRLPHLHRDPFDRILISQAIVHGMSLLTSDPEMSRYPVRTEW